MSHKKQGGGENVDLALEALYARLPRMECRGVCQDCCGPIGMSPAEYRRVSARGVRIPGHAEALTQLATTGCYQCPALDFMGRCSVYDVRPMVCRLWGVVEDMPCPYGCVPEGGHLSSEEGMRLMNESMRVGGHPELGIDPETFEALMKDEQVREGARAIMRGEHKTNRRRR